MPEAAMWDPDHPAIQRERPAGASGGLHLNHPGYPFVVKGTTVSPARIRNIALRYLERVEKHIVPATESFFDANHQFRGHRPWSLLAWLPIDSDPRASFWFRRYKNAAAHQELIDRTVVVLAIQSSVANKPEKRLGSRSGLRIVAHVSGEGSNCMVRITGMSCSSDLLHWMTHATNTMATGVFQRLAGNQYLAIKNALIAGIAGAARVAPSDLSGDGMRVLRNGALEGYANLRRLTDGPNDHATGMTIRMTIPPGFPGVPATTHSFVQRPLVAHAGAMSARMFKADPASKAGVGAVQGVRPNRAPAAFENLRKPTDLPGLVDDGTRCTVLSDTADFRQIEVRQSKRVDKTANEAVPQPLCPAKIRDARTSDFAAGSAYRHARKLFDRMRSYGIAPVDYFRLAAMPLLLRYRATVHPGPGKDGKTVNAQVDFDPPDCDYDAVWDATTLKPMQVRLALADLKRSASRREPLGIAADPRWMWHEFGHVLLAASTGNLELYFAHSAGDALAAIVCDPRSKLGDRPSQRELRGATFPWVYISRRHDREVSSGWSWCGTYHRADHFRTLPNCKHKGYRSEQLLSSSLFRLYRALGGDTVRADRTRDPKERLRAADYSVYLIMRAIGSLGAESAVPIETADQFVTALQDADIATLPASSGPLKKRAGGWAHKVVRWAFEAQGLYASADPTAVVNTPGEPLDVDLYIDDRRPDSEGLHPRGGYVPVSLDWHAMPQPSPWHASAAALKIQNGKVFVEARNRGKSPANATVSLWFIEWPASKPDAPDWNPAKWKMLNPAANAVQVIAPGAGATFGPYLGLPTRKKRYLVLAAAGSPEDPANIDPATDLPCAAAGTPIMDLVSGDNNLGLRLYTP